jgi:hypothetical protein
MNNNAFHLYDSNINQIEELESLPNGNLCLHLNYEDPDLVFYPSRNYIIPSNEQQEQQQHLLSLVIPEQGEIHSSPILSQLLSKFVLPFQNEYMEQGQQHCIGNCVGSVHDYEIGLLSVLNFHNEFKQVPTLNVPSPALSTTTNHKTESSCSSISEQRELPPLTQQTVLVNNTMNTQTQYSQQIMNIQLCACSALPYSVNTIQNRPNNQEHTISNSSNGSSNRMNRRRQQVNNPVTTTGPPKKKKEEKESPWIWHSHYDPNNANPSTSPPPINYVLVENIYKKKRRPYDSMMAKMSRIQP